MFLSYVYSINGIELSTAKQVVNSILGQTDKDFELILISDVSENSEELNEYIYDVFWENQNCKFVENAALQGVSFSWNIGIEIAEGDYVVMIQASDEIKPNHVETLKKAVAKHGEVDIFEYKVHLSGLADSVTKTYVEMEKKYNLSEDSTPYAFINDLIQAKAFKLDVVKHFQLRFRRFVRYDMLFTYKFLGQAKDYLFIDSDALLSTKIEETNFSIFDVVNQWPHIFNYYRRIGKFKELNDELTYSYYKTLIHIWLWWIKKYNNKILMKKAIAFAQRKFEDKKDGFIKSNKIYKEKRDQKFVSIVENLNKWLKDMLKTV